MGHARGYQTARGQSSINKGKWVTGPRMRAYNSKQVMLSEEPNFLR